MEKDPDQYCTCKKETAFALGVTLKLWINVLKPNDVFQECFKGVGKLTDFKLMLRIDEQVKHVRQAIYIIPKGLRDIDGKQLDDLESQDII